MSFLNICLALIVFSVIIIFHEFGHFIVAKYNKVSVLEFSLGMGPRLISWGRFDGKYEVSFFKSTAYYENKNMNKEDTLYSIKLLPFGGSCMMLGEEDLSVEDEMAFGKKTVGAKMAIIFAGPLFNFILAFLIALILIGMRGYTPPVVTDVYQGSGAQEAGLQVGDRITQIGDSDIVINRDISYYGIFNPITDKAIDVVVERDGKEQVLTVHPQKSAEENRYIMGFEHNSKAQSAGFLGTIKYSAYEVKFWIQTTVKSLGMMIKGQVSKDDISGPVGIVKTMGESVEEGNKEGGVGQAAANLLLMCILLSANLGVMNLIPIPALDGGRLLFLFIELIRRKPLPQKFENYVNVAGFALLMGLMVFIMANDILKIFR